ncbi:MAG: hypothetical protein KA803_13360 [Rhodoferax sp.]|mgnify:FL=1|nr:hypothetical protein [Rhodoferax sp.]
MLLDRSKRYAGVDDEIPRLALSSTWQLLVIALLIVALLVLIFPRKALIASLYEQEVLDELTLSYIQNLYRAEPGNADVAILLAKSQQFELAVVDLESMLSPFISGGGDGRQRTQARLLLADAYGRAFDTFTDARSRASVVASAKAMMEQAADDKIPRHLARVFFALANKFRIESERLAYLALIVPELVPKTPEEYAREWLGLGDYATAAHYFFVAREEATNTEDARRLFMTGMGAWMASSQFKQAMLAADQHIGDLDNDLQTLRYLTRVALAAGDPARAAYYARRLVFIRLPVRGTS